MHIIFAHNGFYFSGKAGQLLSVMAGLADKEQKLASFLRQNLQ